MKFQLEITILTFWSKLAQKQYFCSKSRNCILLIQISLNTKFHLELTILIVSSRFSKKEYFWCQAVKVRITIEFCIYKSVLIRNSTSKEQFWYLGPNFPKKRYFQPKTEKLNSAIEFSLFKLV